MSFTDFGDVARTRNQVVLINHVATGKTISFPAFLTEYSDSYSVSWGEETIYGRNDPIKPYSGTTRELQIAFDVLAPSFEKARENLAKFQTFTKMLYPMYSAPLDGSGASLGRTIKAAPLLRIRFVNMIQSAAGDSSLLGCVDGISFTPDKDAGYFSESNGNMFPKSFNISFRFTPQHEEPLGWDATTREFLSNTFPYAAEENVAVAESNGGVNAELNNAKTDRALN
jgi:hypothetical protein|tara:strand:+ start:752 stop:1432 length:681 start_codon:yes stop_codon:yes gene_type:complete